MSLTRIAYRTAVVMALKGKTLVGDNVLDSQIGSLEVDADGQLASPEERPFITVYTDAAKKSDVQLRAFLDGGQTEVVIECGVTAAQTVTDPETGEAYLIPGIPATDDALEFHLDIVMRQIGDALTDPANEWAEIARALSKGFNDIEIMRDAGDANGVRLAAHQMRITLDLIADPVRGVAMKTSHPLYKFFVKAATVSDPKLQSKIGTMMAALAGDELIWQTDIRRYGMTATEAQNLLISPQPGAEDDINIVEVNATPAAPAP